MPDDVLVLVPDVPSANRSNKGQWRCWCRHFFVYFFCFFGGEFQISNLRFVFCPAPFALLCGGSGAITTTRAPGIGNRTRSKPQGYVISGRPQLSRTAGRRSWRTLKRRAKSRLCVLGRRITRRVSYLIVRTTTEQCSVLVEPRSPALGQP